MTWYSRAQLGCLAVCGVWCVLLCLCCNVVCDGGVCGVMQYDVVLTREAGVSGGVRCVVCVVVPVLYRVI